MLNAIADEQAQVVKDYETHYRWRIHSGNAADVWGGLMKLYMMAETRHYAELCLGHYVPTNIEAWLEDLQRRTVEFFTQFDTGLDLASLARQECETLRLWVTDAFKRFNRRLPFIQQLKAAKQRLLDLQKAEGTVSPRQVDNEILKACQRFFEQHAQRVLADFVPSEDLPPEAIDAKVRSLERELISELNDLWPAAEVAEQIYPFRRLSNGVPDQETLHRFLLPILTDYERKLSSPAPGPVVEEQRSSPVEAQQSLAEEQSLPTETQETLKEKQSTKHVSKEVLGERKESLIPPAGQVTITYAEAAHAFEITTDGIRKIVERKGLTVYGARGNSSVLVSDLEAYFGRKIPDATRQNKTEVDRTGQ